MFNFIARDSSQNNVTLEYIRNFEEIRGISFPDVLVDFYMNHNKAVLEDVSFSVHNLAFTVEFIIPLQHGNVCVEKILSFNEKNEYISKTLIPLAEDTDGEDFYWDSASGKVYYISMENVENPVPICDSVEQFFEILNKSCE